MKAGSFLRAKMKPLLPIFSGKTGTTEDEDGARDSGDIRPFFLTDFKKI